MKTPAGDLSGRLMDMLHTDPSSAPIGDQVLANVPLLTRRNRRLTELNDPKRHLEIPRYLPISSMSPYWRRPTCPDSAGVTTQQEAWKWLYRQAREKYGNSDWQHMAHTDGLRSIFAEEFKATSVCEYPSTFRTT